MSSIGGLMADGVRRVSRLPLTSQLLEFSLKSAGGATRGKVEVWTGPGFTVLLLYCEQAGAGPQTCSHVAPATAELWSKIKFKIIIRIVYLHCSSCPLRHSPLGFWPKWAQVWALPLCSAPYLAISLSLSVLCWAVGVRWCRTVKHELNIPVIQPSPAWDSA